MKRLMSRKLIGLTAILAILSASTGCIMFYSSPWYELEVVDAETQRPITGARVAVHYWPAVPIYLNVPGSRGGATDGHGELRLRVPEASGTTSKWVVEAEGYKTLEEIGGRPNEAKHLRFELTPSASE